MFVFSVQTLDQVSVMLSIGADGDLCNGADGVIAPAVCEGGSAQQSHPPCLHLHGLVTHNYSFTSEGPQSDSLWFVQR